jgi:hypothetical protein
MRNVAMLKAGAVAGLMLAAGLMATPAGAQTPEEVRMAELSCVYTGITKFGDDDFFAIGDMVISDVSSGDEFERLSEMVTDVADACTTQHSWDETRIGYGVEIGLQGVVSDTLATDLIDMGMTEAQLRKVDGLLDTMSDADFDRLYYGTWRESPTDRAELDKLWIANGVPQTDTILAQLPAYMEASIVALELIDQWMTDFPL